MARYWYSYKGTGDPCAPSSYVYTSSNPSTFCPPGTAKACAIYAVGTTNGITGISSNLCDYVTQNSNYKMPATGFAYAYKRN